MCSFFTPFFYLKNEKNSLLNHLKGSDKFGVQLLLANDNNQWHSVMFSDMHAELIGTILHYIFKNRMYRQTYRKLFRKITM